jgi:hypothetical protein
VKIVRAALVELKVHAAIEEEQFYPAVRKPAGKEIMNEADEEHHVAKLLIAELDAMDGSESHFDAKFKVLTENVRRHIEEEEGEMLPKARKMKLDFAALAERMTARTEKLLEGGVPPVGEEAMVKASPGQGRLARLSDVLIRGNVVYDTGRDGVIRDGKPVVTPPRCRYAVLVESGPTAPVGLHFSNDLFHPGSEGVSNVELTP